MGKSVTYAIGFAKAWPFADEIWEEKKRLKAALANDQKIDAAHASLEIADLLIAQCEDLESRNDHHDYDTDKFLEEALSYCDKARRTFTAEQHQAGLSRAYELMVQCYQRLCQYESAIAKGRSLLDLLQQQLGHNNPSLQAAFKSLADVYFKRGHDPSLSKFDDFENARSYYLKERALLDIMTAEDVDGDPLVLSDLIRSSNFNLGVIESKFPGGEQKAEEYLVLAVKQAQQLDDIENEKRAWWELGNVFRKQRNLERLLQCQKKELDLITTHDFKDDEIPCLVECVKTYLELDNYPKCLDLCRTIRALEDSEDNAIGSSTVEMVISMQTAKREIDQLPSTPDGSNSLERARLYYQLAHVQFENSMIQVALRSVDEGLSNMDVEASMSEDLSAVCIDFLQLKAACVWQLQSMSMVDFEALNKQILRLVRNKITHFKQRLEQSMLVFERLIRMYDYYNMGNDAEHWRKVADIAEEQYENEDEDEMEIEEIEKKVWPYPLKRKRETEPVVYPVKIIRTAIPLYGKIETMYIPSRDKSHTVEWLMEEASKRTFEKYGVEPNITHLRVNGANLYIKDLLKDVIPDEKQTVDMVIDGFKKKTLQQLYVNICSRLKIPVKEKILMCFKHAQADSLPLYYSELTPDDSAMVREFLRLCPHLTYVSLSNNLFDDESIRAIFQGMTIPSRLDLASNRLTVATLDFLCQHAGPTLTKLCMSNNNLGPMALQRLPDLFSACTSLKTLELSSCDLGDYMLLDNTTIEKYNQMRLDDDAVPVELDISQNHFDGDMLSGWTPYLVKLGRIQKLQCRGITTDSPWDTLGLLSDLPFLTSLDLDDTAASSWSASDLRDILQKSIHLERLSLCNCYLTPQDVTTICQGVAVSSYLRWLSLSNNRRVNLTIAQAVNDMNSDLTANTCDCGLTSQHHPAFCQCRNIGDTAAQLLGDIMSNEIRPPLESLCLENCGLTSKSLSAICQCMPHLRYLSIGMNPALCQKIEDIDRLLDTLIESPRVRRIELDVDKEWRHCLKRLPKSIPHVFSWPSETFRLIRLDSL